MHYRNRLRRLRGWTKIWWRWLCLYEIPPENAAGLRWHHFELPKY